MMGQFWRGRVVLEREPAHWNNPGHVIGFEMKDGQWLVRVEFANGDRYNVLPGDLHAL
jgi:hypothetical protein